MHDPPGNPSLVQQFLAERDAPCPGCGYNLRGSAGGVCPECARPIDLHVRDDTAAVIGRRLVVVALWAMLLYGFGSGLESVMMMVRFGGTGFPGYVPVQFGTQIVFGAAQGGLCAWGLLRMRRSAKAGRAAGLTLAVRLLLVLIVARVGLAAFWGLAWPLAYGLIG